jgi:Family of unknown function (DUF6364)
MKTKVTLTLEDSNWQKLRIYAIENKTSASAIIDELIAGYLKKSTRRGKRKSISEPYARYRDPKATFR